MKACIFCGSTTNKITNEHLWPLWITELLRKHGMQKIAVTHTGRPHGKEAVVRKRIADTLDLTAKVVCKKCNNEDLSDLENKHVKPILAPMIVPTGPTVLHKEQQLILSAWIMKMAMVLEFTQSDRFFFTQEDREQFFTTVRPPTTHQTWIWLTAARTDHISHCTQDAYFLHKNPADTTISSTTVVINSFGFQVLCRREHKGGERGWNKRFNRIERVWADAMVPIYPSGGTIRWPGAKCVKEHTLQPFCKRWKPSTAD